MGRTLRVLHVEDSERDAALITRHLLRAGFELTSERVETERSMRAALETREWDVILCDYSMPEFNALRALALVQEMAVEIPFIIISGTIGEEVAVEAMRAGANDYLMKDKLARLGPAIEREMQEAENQRARQRTEIALKDSEAELRALFEAMTDVILVLDSAGRHLKMAPTRSASVYRPTDDRTAKTVHEIYPPETADLFLACIRRALDEGCKQRVEYSLPISGQETWFEGSVSPMTNDSVIWIARDITERKDAEQQLRLQATTLQSAANAIVITDKEGLISWVNRAFTTQTGYTLEEVTGGNANILKSGVHDQAFYQDLWKIILSGQVWQGEITNLRKDGSTYVEEQTITPVLNEAGEITNFIAIKQEITERKLAEQEQARLNVEIESQRRRLNNIVASVPGVVWEVWGGPHTVPQRTNYVSDYVETMLGYSVAEWLATPNFWLSVVHPSDRGRTLRAAAAELAGGETSRTLEVRWVTKDGRVLWVQSNFAVMTDDEGRSVGLRGVTIDVTERKRAEDELRNAKDFSENLIQTANVIILSLDTEGNIEIFNEAAQQITGYTAAELRGCNWFEKLAPKDKYPGVWEEFKRIVAGGLPTTFENPILTRSGEERQIMWQNNVIKVDGKVIATISFGNDLTERKHLENQLRQSQKLEAIGMLAGGIAHDFNNLLTVISGYSDLTLLRLRKEDPLYRNLSEVKKAAERAAGLTRQLLAFSRKQVMQPKVLALNAVVSELEKLLRRLIGEDIGLRTVLGTELGSIKADPGQIEQIIMNLAVNARDAMPHGGRLTIETVNVNLDEEYSKKHIAVIPGPYVLLAVTDSGTGMDQETQARIFEPFFTTKEAGKGTGLGLSTVYGIVKQSGGNIWVYSEMGVGTTFKVYFPRLDQGAEDYSRNDERGKTIHGTETILLAEDEEGVRQLTRQVLEMCGYQVLEAVNGPTALEIFARHTKPIHLLLTDVIMPEMSGRELADRLTPLAPKLKVLFMSGYTDNAIVHHGVLTEGASFIQKPFSTIDLARKVREVLDQN